MFVVKDRVLKILSLVVFLSIFHSCSQLHSLKKLNFIDDIKLLVGEASNLPASWVGTKEV